MKMDWKNIDISALLGSKVAVGAIVTIITGIASISGHAIPFEQQSQMSNDISQILGGVSALAGMWTFYHRAVADPTQAAVIVPPKPNSPTPPTT